jgi:hypothetical protein
MKDGRKEAQETQKGIGGQGTEIQPQRTQRAQKGSKGIVTG